MHQSFPFFPFNFPSKEEKKAENNMISNFGTTYGFLKLLEIKKHFQSIMVSPNQFGAICSLEKSWNWTKLVWSET